MELPKRWGEVTIEKYLKARPVMDSTIITDPIDRGMRLISMLSGATLKEVEALKVNEILDLMKKLDFLKELPSEKILRIVL